MPKRKPRPKPSRADIAVCAGDTFRVSRISGPARHVRIATVRTPAHHQPYVYYDEVTRTGNSKPGEPIRHQLTWRDGRWRMSQAFEPVDLP